MRDLRSPVPLADWYRGPNTSGRPAVVGVVNVTPDSFSDGGRFLSPEAACAQVDRLLDEGADVIEIGGESTRPAGSTYGSGYAPVDAQTQLSRIEPVVRYAVDKVLVSVDTTLPEVAARCLSLGARIINDVSCLSQPEMAAVCRSKDVWLVLMHARAGAASRYDDVVADVAREWCRARDRAVSEGVDPARIVFDPGLGFGKGPSDGFELIARLSEFHALGHAIFIGPSRKAFIAEAERRAGLSPSSPSERIGGTIACCLATARAGVAALRVHDVRAMRQALAMEAAIRNRGSHVASIGPAAGEASPTDRPPEPSAG